MMAGKKELSRETLIKLLETMLTIRHTETEIVRLYARGEIPGGCHTYIGEEAVAAGVCANLDREDIVYSTHRGHGHALAKGMPPQTLLAEILGRETGSSGGRGGSMHLFAPELGFFGTSGIVGPSIGLATGAGYAFAYRKQKHVAAAFFGDGASNNGIFHEAINLAAAFQLPTIFICENNLYATEVHIERVSASDGVVARAAGLGLPGVQVDGNNVLDVYNVAAEAAKRARSGGGPTLIECLTYRQRAHAEGMREIGYRSEDEVSAWKERDPITSFMKYLVDQKIEKQEALEALQKKNRKEIQAAAAEALKAPFPDPATVTDHVFSSPLQEG
jgi:2-oxoisovalerate dehydrogenase E1 component